MRFDREMLDDFRAAHREIRKRRDFTAMVYGVVAVTLSLYLWLAWNHPQPHHIALLLLPASMLVIMIASWAFFRKQLYAHLRRRRRERGHQVCIQCGYMLTGLKNGRRCPECGVGLESANDSQMGSNQQSAG
jgi:hypothetical protein